MQNFLFIYSGKAVKFVASPMQMRIFRVVAELCCAEQYFVGNDPSESGESSKGNCDTGNMTSVVVAAESGFQSRVTYVSDDELTYATVRRCQLTQPDCIHTCILGRNWMDFAESHA